MGISTELKIDTLASALVLRWHLRFPFLWLISDGLRWWWSDVADDLGVRWSGMFRAGRMGLNVWHEGVTRYGNLRIRQRTARGQLGFMGVEVD